MEKNSEKTKCYVCNKKISLIEMIVAKCKCDNYFCTKHKFASNVTSLSSHTCNYDYIQENKVTLQINNNQVIASKVDKI